MSPKIKLLILTLLISATSCGQSKEKALDKARFINYEAIVKYPNSNRNVNDFETLFTKAQSNELDSIIMGNRDLTTNQICIVTVDSYDSYTSLKDFTTDLGNYWGIGSSGKNNGLLFTISKNKRTIWIGTGLGTENILTDDKVKNIIDASILPFFKKGEYFEGTKSGLLECISSWK